MQFILGFHGGCAYLIRNIHRSPHAFQAVRKIDEKENKKPLFEGAQP